MMTPSELREYEFKGAGRNAYKSDDVDNFFGEVAVAYEKIFRENAELIKRVGLLADRLEQFKNDEEQIKQAVIGAQKAADIIVKEAEMSVEDSKAEAEAIRRVTEAIRESKTDPATYMLAMKYIETLNAMVSGKDNKTIYIKGGQKYKPCDVRVEGDWSNAAFLDAFNLIGGNVQVNDLDENSVQGDKIYKTIFKELENENISVDISDCPDLGPVLMALGAAKNGITLTGTHRLKIKESDRGAAMALELSKFGIEVINYENSIIVKKGELQTPNSKLHSHNDHRIVMSLSILCSMVDGEISDAQAINKSFPNFFDEIQNLGIKIKVN